MKKQILTLYNFISWVNLLENRYYILYIEGENAQLVTKDKWMRVWHCSWKLAFCSALCYVCYVKPILIHVYSVHVQFRSFYAVHVASNTQTGEFRKAPPTKPLCMKTDRPSSITAWMWSDIHVCINTKVSSGSFSHCALFCLLVIIAAESAVMTHLINVACGIWALLQVVFPIVLYKNVVTVIVFSWLFFTYTTKTSAY